MALEAGILSDAAAGRQPESGLSYDRFVMFLVLTGRAQGLGLACAFVGDDDVLHRVALLLAAIVLPLSVGVFGSLNRAFRTINDEGRVGTGDQHLGHGRRLPDRQRLYLPRGLIQDGGQVVNPDTGLPLADAKEEALRHLSRIHAKVEQEEDQLVGQSGQRGFAPTATPPFPGLRLLCIGRVLGRAISLLEGRQRLRKGSQR